MIRDIHCLSNICLNIRKIGISVHHIELCCDSCLFSTPVEGVTVKVYRVDLEEETIHPPVSVRAYLTQTVTDFKALVAQVSLPK